MKKVGIALIIIGLVLTIFTAFTVFTKEKVVDIGSMHIYGNKAHHLYWSPLIGVAVMIIGGVIVFIPPKKL